MKKSIYNNYFPPAIIEETQFGERVVSIYSKLLKERIILLSGPIIDSLANSVIAQLLYLEHQDPERDIKLYINTPGGTVSAGLAIYDTIQYIKPPVVTICTGMAASMGAVLLASGAKGKRMSLPNAEILLHQVMVSGIEGQAVEVEITAKHVIKLKDKINQILAKHTGQPLKKIAKDTDRDFYLTPEEAKKYGLIDKIIKPHH